MWYNDAMTRAEVNENFRRFIQKYDTADPKIQLKIVHTMHVADLCDTISDSLHLNQEDRDLAWTIGMYHDVGRFEQLRLYHTFNDAQSVNHAQLGASLLLRGALGPVDALIVKAVALHNVYILPELNEREQLFCDLIRDADKIDILRVNRESSVETIYDLPMAAFQQSSISEPVMKDLMQHRTVDRTHRQTAMDAIAGHISFIFGLVYPKSVQIVMEQGYLRQLLDFPSENPKTKEQLHQIDQEIDQYVKEKIKERAEW